MTSIFDAVDLKAATTIVSSAALTPSDQEAWDYYIGDHWRDAEGWIGQLPPVGTPQRELMIGAIKRTFVSENVTAEIVHRHTAGVLGREPRWGFVVRRPLDDGEDPTEAEMTTMKELDTALTSWWDSREVLLRLKEAVDRALVVKRAPFRILIPAGLRSADGTVQATNLDEALDKIFIDTPDPDAAGVFVEDNTRQKIGIFLFDRVTDAYAFPGLLPTTAPRKMAEVTFLNDDRDTELLLIDDTGPVEAADPPLRLDGHILHYELQRDPIVTEQVRQQQRALNLNMTQMLRNVNLAGSLERIFVNLMPPGQYVDSAGRPYVKGVSTGDPIFKQEALPVGAGVSAFLRGYETFNEEGEATGYSQGTVNYRDPVDVQTFVDTRDMVYQSILNQVDQRHAVVGSVANVSGDALKQYRSEYENSLNHTKNVLDALGRWLLETVAYYAAILMGQPGAFEEYRCEFGSIIDPGPLSADDRKSYMDEHTAGLASAETTMSRLGTDDVTAELARIAIEQEAKDQAAADRLAQFGTLQDGVDGQQSNDQQNNDNNPPGDNQQG